MNISTTSTISAIIESAEFTITGRAAADPDLRYLDGGKAVAKVRIAVNNGKDSEPHWFTVEAWEDLAEELANSVSKAGLVTATGRITTKKWATKAGEERVDTVIKAREIRAINAQPKVETTSAMPF
jgi:single-strand DNA-binding protein